MSGNLIVVNLADIASLIDDDNPANNKPNIPCAELNEFHFSSLWAILLGNPSSDEYDSRVEVTQSEDGEKWVITIPNELIELIAKQTDSDMSPIASKWATIEEFKWGWSEATVSELFQGLVSLSKQAVNNDQALVYCGAL